jgi:hypothetical protein
MPGLVPPLPERGKRREREAREVRLYWLGHATEENGGTA